MLAVVAAAAATAALAGCGGGSSSSDATTADTESGKWGAVLRPDGTPKRGGTLTVDQVGAPKGVSSLYYVDHAESPIGQVVEQIYDQLVEFEPGSLEPRPGLAESWTISDDARTFTFHLRDAKFSNGTPVTSADVRYSLDYARRPASGYYDLYKVISRIETPDARTVVVKLSAPSRAFIYYTAYIAASIVPAQLVKSQGQKAYNDRPVGSGPFMIKSWKRNREIDLVRNPSHWNAGRPYLDAVKLVGTPNANTRSLNIQSGTVDVADSPAFSQIRTIDAGGKAKVLIAPGADMNVVWINNSRQPLNELAVRRALAYATPVDSIVKVVYAGLAPRMNTIIPKLKYWTDAAEPYPYDLEKAKQELGKSSVPSGFSVTVNIVNTDDLSAQAAQILQSAWAKIGVRLQIRPVDDATFGDAYVSGGYELTLFAPGSFPSNVPVDDQFAQLVFDSPGTNNLFTWSENPAAAKLARQAVASPDEAQRVELFRQLHVLSMQHVPVIPLVYTPNRAAVANRVHNFNYLLGGLWRLDSVWIG